MYPRNTNSFFFHIHAYIATNKEKKRKKGGSETSPMKWKALNLKPRAVIFDETRKTDDISNEGLDQ